MYQHPLLQEAERNQVKHYFSLTLASRDQPHPIPSKVFLTDNLEDGPDDHGGGGGVVPVLLLLLSYSIVTTTTTSLLFTHQTP